MPQYIKIFNEHVFYQIIITHMQFSIVKPTKDQKWRNL